jgi:type II secretory pathway pseudopilin PulG
MFPTAFPEPTHRRHGITLMEVLISIGIIAIGLTSVMSLIPAGKSQAGKAIVSDRAAAMALNGLADAVTFGLTKPASLVITATTASTLIFDPADTANLIPWPGVVSAATLKSAGVLAASSMTSATPRAVEKLFTQGRDDVAYNLPATTDDLPTNGFINGIRGFEGRMTSLFALTEADNGTPPLTAGDFATLSVIVFHNRDMGAPSVTGTMDASGRVTVSSLPAGQTLKSVLRPGAVLYYVDPNTPRLRFAQLSMAAVDTSTGDTYVTFTGRPAPNSTVPVTVLVDSVGLGEQSVSLEGPSVYGQ